MLKIRRQNPLREIQRLQNDETIVRPPPRDEPIRRRIVHHLVRLHHKRRYCIITTAAAVIVNLHPAHNGSDPHTQIERERERRIERLERGRERERENREELHHKEQVTLHSI